MSRHRTPWTFLALVVLPAGLLFPGPLAAKSIPSAQPIEVVGGKTGEEVGPVKEANRNRPAEKKSEIKGEAGARTEAGPTGPAGSVVRSGNEGSDPHRTGDPIDGHAEGHSLGGRLLEWWKQSKAFSWLRSAVSSGEGLERSRALPQGIYLRSPLLTGRLNTITPCSESQAGTATHEHDGKIEGATHPNCPEPTPCSTGAHDEHGTRGPKL